jgi:micrococcal nuclease
MRRKKLLISFIIFLLLTIFSTFFESEFEEKVEEEVLQTQDVQNENIFTVTRIVDGDTIVVQQEDEEFRVRMIGIDTPESVHPNKPVEYFGIEASKKLKELIENKNVELKKDGTQDDVDRYGRLLRYVYLDDVDINLEMIKQGYAFEYTYRIPYEKQQEYKQAQEDAKLKNLGLWRK